MAAIVLGAFVGMTARARPAPRLLNAAAPLSWRRPSWPRPRWPSRDRASRTSDDDVASWCEHVAGFVRSGHSLASAIGEAGAAVPAAGAGFAPVTHALSRGRSLADAVGLLDGDPRLPVGLVRAVLSSCAELGGPAAAPLDRAAVTLRARSAERAERQASSAQARLSARVLTLLPIGTLALLTLSESSIRRTLATPAGLVCLAGGVSCNVAGWWWMRRIVEGAA